MNIPFYKPSIDENEIDEVVATLRGGWLTTGPRTKQFEKEFATYLNQKHAVALNSCTAALHLALEAIGLQSGQGVLVPTMTFAATAEVVRYFGARPVLADCRTDDLNLDIVDAERQIKAELAANREVVAIMPVHYGGQICDMQGVQRLAKTYNLKIIEDAAHCCPAYFQSTGLGASSTEFATPGSTGPAPCSLLPTPSPQLPAPSPQLPTPSSLLPAPSSEAPAPSSLLPAPRWLPVGASADISCFSFYANKTITTGEGGMACTNNDEYADRMRIMSLHGISRDAWKRFTAEGSWYYEIIAPGFKYNLTDIASAIGIHQLRKADLFHERRTAIVARYQELLGGIQELILPRAHEDRIHSWHLFAIRLRVEKLKIDRAQFIKELQQQGIGTSVHWLPLHMHPYYRETYAYNPQDFPTAANLYPQLVTLPLYPDMTEEEVTHVCNSIKQVIASSLRAGH